MHSCSAVHPHCRKGFKKIFKMLPRSFGALFLLLLSYTSSRPAGGHRPTESFTFFYVQQYSLGQHTAFTYIVYT